MYPAIQVRFYILAGFNCFSDANEEQMDFVILDRTLAEEKFSNY